MKLFTKTLILFLGLTVLIPAKLGLLCLFGTTDALAFFSLQSLHPDAGKLLVVLGGFVLAMVVFQLLAIIWLIKAKAEGFVISTAIGIISIGRGLLMLALLPSHTTNDMRISISPIVIGAFILILTAVAIRKEKLK